MTQAQKEDEARATMELRDRKKKYRAAGFKPGVVLEEFVEEKAETAAATGAAGGGAGGGGGGGASGREGGGGGWRKVAPLALSIPAKQVAGERP